ncbi:MAG: hypothetical protein O6768_00815 [Planctomycetota bacterium]|nr:hypothetical protein [Planctomycetota bacterium]
MEFVAYSEVMDLLKEQGVREVPAGDDRICLELVENKNVVHLHLACRESTSAPRPGASVVAVAKDRLPGFVEHIIHKLHLNQVILIPIAKWRKVFDAVAFSMAENEDWQAVDTAATVELNTRDPLLCDPGDFHTLNALIKVLISDADSPDQGLMITTTAAPVVVELVPDGAVRISIGDPVLADEVAEAYGA